MAQSLINPIIALNHMNLPKKIISQAFIFVLIFQVFFVSQSGAAISDWQKGAIIFPTFQTDFSSDSFKQSLRNLASTNVNSVTFIIPYFQSNVGSTDIQAGGNTPTDQSLIDGINFAKSLGVQVVLSIHLDSFDGNWRANINPGDKTTWFRNYSAVVFRYADIAQQTGVGTFVIGTELVSMTTSSPQGWRDIIAGVRQRFSGKLTYSSNWGPSGFVDEKNQVQFWDALDYVGVSGYFELNTGSNDVNSLRNAWDAWNFGHIKPLADRTGKPILFTEVGYRSVTGAHTRPWDFNLGGSPDETEQANSYEALITYWNNFPYMVGVHFWHWETNPNAGGPGTTTYTPQRKQAESTMRNLFGAGAPISTPPPNPTNPSFNTSSSPSPASPNPEQNTTITTTVNNTDGSISSAIVDVEVFNSAGAQVFQQAFEGQNFAPGETKTFTSNWTAGPAGTYTAKVGIFNNTWGTIFNWNNSAGTINVQGAAQPPAPSPQPSAFQTSSTFSPVSPQVNQPVSIAAQVVNSGGQALNNGVVDIEIFSNSGQRIFQWFFENQNIAPGQTQTLNVNWTPNQTGTFLVKMGVFTQGWGNLLSWNDNAGEIPVAGGAGAPSQPTDLQVWWPGNGVTVSGVQPFKAAISGLNLPDYQMFWQVDGGGLNGMADDFTDAPHKEALVEVNPWTWKGNGPYAINFVGKNPSGTTLMEKLVQIFIAR